MKAILSCLATLLLSSCASLGGGGGPPNLAIGEVAVRVIDLPEEQRAAIEHEYPGEDFVVMSPRTMEEKPALAPETFIGAIGSIPGLELYGAALTGLLALFGRKRPRGHMINAGKGLLTGARLALDSTLKAVGQTKSDTPPPVIIPTPIVPNDPKV